MGKLFALFVIGIASQLNSISQTVQFGISSGPALLYVVEDASTDMDYFYGMAFQTDFTYLKDDGIADYGFSLSSASAEMHTSNFYYGLINNTGFSAKKYFSWKFLDVLSTNFNIGAGPNFEAYSNNYRLMLNLHAGIDINAEVIDGWHIQIKAQAVGQDAVNIVRYYSTNSWETAGEDLHLMLLFGLAKDFVRLRE